MLCACKYVLISISVLPPIPTTGLTADDVDKLTNDTREKMLDELVKLTEIARAQRVSLTSDERKRLLDDNDSAQATGSDGVSSGM